ncbi:methyltransferase domain-containing protein [Novosphingobium sp. PS1R-30]|uniref:Methyltransferase domain-containing protein n=1 Tax=Novosphingobium anseongense TaxID=3133436 RepID=A0ABU8S0L0_9SPHN
MICSDQTRPRIEAAFDAAQNYETHARVQRRVAEALADRIAALPVVAARGDTLRLLEIGCGTGLLTRALQDRGIGGHWLVTDIAPRMVSRCATAMADHAAAPALTFAVLDGSAPPASLTPGSFDLICSSMAFQWFADLGPALARLADLLAPGGTLAFSTLLDGTFAEWEEAHRREGLDAGGLRYPSLHALSGLFPRGGNLSARELHARDAYAGAGDFLRALKRIGAATPRSDHRPLPPASLRRVMKAFDRMGAAATYRVALCNWTSPTAKDELSA